MAYSRSFSGWRYRYKYGTRSSRRWKSGSRLRALGNAKAARQQRDAATVTINKIAQISATIPANESASSVIINHWNMLRLSDYFPNYAPMYDQMKLNKIRVKLTGFRAGTAQTANISPAVVLAFDRNGLNPGQTVSPALISTYSSAQLKQWSTGNSFSMYQTIYPSTIMEKGQYIPTGSLDDPEDNAEPTNPCFNESDSTLPFKPITLLSVDLGATVGAAAQTFAFTAEFEYTVTFRGMRKPSLSSSPALDLIPFADTLTRNGRYRVTAEQAGVDGWNSVDILVNVPPPDSQIDAISIFDYTNNAYFLLATLNVQDLSFTVSDTGYVNVPVNTLLIYVISDAIILPTDNLGVVVLQYNQNLSTQNVYIGINVRYVLVPISITGTSGVYSLNVGSDPLVYKTFYPNVFNEPASFYVDHEDLDLFLN